MEAGSSRINLHDLTYQSLASMLSDWGFSSYHANVVWRYLYVNMIESFDQLLDIRADLLDSLRERTYLDAPTIVGHQSSEDGLTEKFLLALGDGEKIECVAMRYDGRITACISSQVGCAMGCVSCATGQMGFRRNLSSGEIIAQVLFLARRFRAQDEQLRNVVFMGMGEPLHNYEATVDAISILTDDRGLAIGPRYVTLSTVGLPAGIRRLIEEDMLVNLAVSLHAVTDSRRNELVPVSVRWPLDELMESCRLYAEKRKRRIFFEWALIAGVNDSGEQAAALGQLLQGIDSHVNLIPVNPTRGFDKKPAGTKSVKRFQTILSEHGIPSTIRQKRGIDIQAGCGQLRSRMERK